MNDKVKCKECIFFYGDEFKVNIHYLFPEEIKKLHFEMDQNNNLLTLDEAIRMCHHSNCFISNSPNSIEMKIFRIKGQKQLNHDGECPRFIYKRRYKLWNKIKGVFKWK